MTYAALPDLILRYGELQVVQLTDRAEPPSGLVGEQVAGDALVYATSTIDGYVGARYRLPLVGPQPVLRELALDLAWYRLQREPTKETADRYNAAIKSLKDIASGALILAGQAGAAEQTARNDRVEMVSEPRRFTRRSLRGL